MNNIKILISILIILSIIPIVHAMTPPEQVNISGYVVSHYQTGTWFRLPNDTDYAGYELFYDEVYIGNFSSPTHFYNAEFLSVGDHTLYVYSYDTKGNVNTSFNNLTMYVGSDCHESWFCGDYCTPFGFVPIETKVPISPENVSQGQPSAQTSSQYSDVYIWGLMVIATLVCLLLSRDTSVKTVFPVISGMIGIITSIAAVWMSLSIAYIGDFTKGITIDYINQTNSQLYFYQVIKVVAQPWITIVCLVITIFMIINIVDIIMMYVQKSEQMEQIQKQNDKDWKI